MKFPAYWSKATAEDLDRDGKKVSASCWQWSETSKENAHESALVAAKRVLQHLIRGKKLDRYSYGQRPLREEVIQTHSDDEGNLAIAVSRNSYGALVLNTSSVMFIDIDFVPTTFGESLRYFISRLFGGKGPSPEARQEAEAKGKLEEQLSIDPRWGVRLYRTFAGMRVLVTHTTFDPVADVTLSLLNSVGSDPLYVRLCRDQECFRARLTPKPWRSGHAANRVVWPHENDEQKRRFEQWLAEYDKRHSGYATCRFLGTLGDETVHPEVMPVITIHDKLTRCSEALPLA